MVKSLVPVQFQLPDVRKDAVSSSESEGQMLSIQGVHFTGLLSLLTSAVGKATAAANNGLKSILLILTKTLGTTLRFLFQHFVFL